MRAALRDEERPQRRPQLMARRRSKRAPVLAKDKYAASTTARAGCEVLEGAKHVGISTQVRSKDVQHNAFMEKMGRGEQVTMEELKRLYQPLRAKDLKDVKKGWYQASIVVTTNRERYDLTDLVCQAFAHVHRTHVIRWPMLYRKWEGKPRQAEHVQNAVQDDPCFWQYYVKGAEAFLVENYARKEGLVNARKLACVGLVPHKDDEERLTRAMRESPVGSVISLDREPEYVVMEVVGGDPELWQDLTIVKDRAVIAIHSRQSKDWNKVTVYEGLFYGPSRVQVRRVYPFDLAFALTVHKAQGRTVRLMIVAVSKRGDKMREMTYSHLYVALSRVRRRKNVRLLVHDRGAGHAWGELLYVNDLLVEPCIEVFFQGFQDGDNSPWSFDRTQAAGTVL